jgi:Ca-activated chloride channel family protein
VVIDRSGSMAGEKLAFVKQAALDLVRRLGTKDQLSLVAYDTTVEVLVPPMAVDGKAPFGRAIQGLQSRATTNLSGGWLQGCEFVVKGLAEKQVNRVLLLTDGLANVGVTDPNALAAMTRQRRAEGITTTTLGVGLDFNEDLLTRGSPPPRSAWGWTSTRTC